MPITSPHDLRSRADALLRDTLPLHTAAGLGFVADAPVVDAALASFDPAAWSVVDARGATDDVVREAIVKALGAQKPIALVVPCGGAGPMGGTSASANGAHGATPSTRGTASTRAPVSALLFAQGVAERRHGGPARVDLGDLVPRAVPDDVNVVVLAEGASDHARLPRQLQQVDFWEFLP